MTLSTWRKLRLAAFWATVVAANVAALMPADRAPSVNQNDKINHILAFLVLTLLARVAFPGARRWIVLVGLSIFGAWIEATQAVPLFHRDADVRDWIADTLAIVVMLLVLWPIEKRLPQIFAPDRR